MNTLAAAGAKGGVVPARAILLVVLGALAACARSASAPRTADRLATSPAADWPAARCFLTAPDDRADADADRLDDGCELALARAFAPELVVDPRECLWLPGARPARLAGGYLFAAQPVAPATVRLAYLPGYARDCGWDGTLCRLRPGGCGAHAGDSELILVDVTSGAAATPGRWGATAIFLSAHCGGRSAGRCRWFRGAELARLAWTDGAPRVWVARGKHAHYPSARACDRGHWGYDACDRNTTVVRFPIVGAAQNVGSRAHPLPAPAGCRTAGALPLGPQGLDPAARECVWDAARPFRGWQADARGAGPTSYGRSLVELGGF